MEALKKWWSKVKPFIWSSRVKSFTWRLAMVGVVAMVDDLIQNLTAYNLSAEVTVILGLVLGEISKHLNNKYYLKK